MTDSETIARVLDAADKRRLERRQFLRSASVAGLAIGGSSLLAACGSGDKNKAPTPTPTSSGSPTPTPTASSTPSYDDTDAFAFALNLEYLEAQFFLHAAFGSGLADDLTKSGDGKTAGGAVTGGRKVAFTDSVLAEYAREIAADERAHVTFLRTQLGSSVLAQPAINIDGGASGAFTAAARAAGIVGSSGTFDPYASDANFLLAAFLLEDVMPTAYRGAIVYVSSTPLREATAGLAATEAYHSGLIRSTIYASGDATLIANAGKFSNLRDSLDGTTDDDQGVATDANGASNIVPADPSNGIVFARTPAQVLNIAFLTGAKATKGGFFPNGVNGTITTSAGS
ncbi:MAG TPA: ferritin-like domain-containing protein [Sphingomonas sp.]|nr:ferritin-like domain-containing protein [Sphingomonas sp.]